MKNFIILFFLISFGIITSCNTNDVEHALVSQVEFDQIGEANFTIENKDNTLWEKDDLLLTNTSVNAESYHWDFGNGDTSSEANPNYEYDIHGYYDVTLTITDAQGDTKQSSQEILVLCLFGGGNHTQ